MKILTFGWDFPPETTGGLGIACQGLTSELAEAGVEVIFVLPKTQNVSGPSRFVFADSERIKFKPVSSEMIPYGSSGSLVEVFDANGHYLFSRHMLEEVYAYARKAVTIAEEEEFDLIHAHDWTSYLAGIAAKTVSSRPLILHVHATTFDQAAGDNIDPSIYEIEQTGFRAADKIVAVSQFTKDLITEKYGISPDRIEVVHNGCDLTEPPRYEPTLKELKDQGKKIILYHGRITIQKGIDYFVRAARIVVDHDPDVVFVVSGKGDMEGQIMRQVGALGLSQNFIFAGALWYEERDRMYQTADLVVMPSVSEPFGLVPLEAVAHGTPSLISKKSGVSEVISHVLKVDFWDVEEMANKMMAALRYPVMNQQLVKEGRFEIKNLSWRRAAQKIVALYRRLLNYLTT